MMKNLYKFPPIDQSLISPRWSGESFIINGRSYPILEYSENFSGWSDDLTLMHEDSAGNYHPIDVMSRALAVQNIKSSLLCEEDKVILEIGCSSGYLLEALLEAFPSYSIMGADVVKQPLYDLAKKKLGIPLLRFDLLKCPLPNNCIDVLVMLNVLEHIEDDQLALKKAYHLLKPDGIVVIEVPAGQYLYDQYDRELKHFRRYSSKELCKKLENAGFIITRKTYLGFLAFPLFALVKLKNKLIDRKHLDSRKYVIKSASNTSKSFLLKLLFFIEFKFLSKIETPFGIRVVVVARRKK